jgi:hypothetical protein
MKTGLRERTVFATLQADLAAAEDHIVGQLQRKLQLSNNTGFLIEHVPLTRDRSRPHPFDWRAASVPTGPRGRDGSKRTNPGWTAGSSSVWRRVRRPLRS